MGLSAEKRQKSILDNLRSDGRIKVPKLAGNLGVTEVTIRRDLGRLHTQGLLQKTYGGAILAKPPETSVPLHYRQTKNLNAKKTIGKLAGSLINDGDIIYLEAGSTCFEIIPYLSDRKDLTVIVNSLYLMSRLHEMTKHKVILTGGLYRPYTMDMVGPVAEETISQLGGYRAFTGADDISIESGLSGADIVTIRFAKLVLQRASQTIFVGDHTKFDNPALYKFADIEQLDYIVTDRKPAQQWLDITSRKKITLFYPQTSQFH